MYVGSMNVFVLLFGIVAFVSCRPNANGNLSPWPFMSRKESSVFLYSKRNKRSINCQAEGACEANKDYCRQESDRELYCNSHGTSCSAGQFCQLTTPCPVHFETACIDIDECDSSPCKNGATCYNGNNLYTCTCTAGWTGANCDQDIDECTSNPCNNGATCNNGHNSYTCTCASGWTGTHCETDIDECSSNPCANGATCTDVVNGYTCSCTSGWTGNNCQTDYDECQSDPCQNGASCNNGPNAYTCSCSAGWVGTNCETDVDECLSSPCVNGGTCNNENNAYTCSCPSGWTGVNCDMDYDECQSNPCVNGATCNNKQNAYTCSCTSGWIGDNCDSDNDECQSNPCVNGATCNNEQNAYTCSCTSGWIGDNCDSDNDECQSNPCVNGATCNNEQNAYTCSCTSGWIGDNCDMDYDECQSNPCVNGATCKNEQDAYTCSCTPDYNECDSNPCQNSATCRNEQNKYTCSCVPGWTGVNCETDIDECSSFPCQNDGMCTDLLNQFMCTCSEDFTGLRCETDMCAPSNQNGADIVFVLDSSKSQDEATFTAQKEYVKNFVLRFPVGPNDFQFAVVSVLFNATVHIYLDSFNNASAIIEVVNSITTSEGPSQTGKALQAVREDVLSLDKANRPVPKYAIVLTDGLSSEIADTVSQADMLKGNGINVIAVGIGRQVLHEELIYIASHSSKVFPVASTDAIYSIMKVHVMPSCPDCFTNTSDVAVLMDVSSNLPIKSFYGQLDALRTLIKALPIGEDGVHVSYTRFADVVMDEFDFTRYKNIQNLIIALSVPKRLAQMNGAANLSLALDQVLQNGFIASKGRRSNARQILFLFSNGIVSDTDDVKLKAQQLRDDGVTIVTISNGLEISMETLIGIASDPMFVYVLGDDVNTGYDVLYSLIGTLEYDVCEFD